MVTESEDASRDLAALRQAYADVGLEEAAAPADPTTLLDRWLGDAIRAGLREPNAMLLATVDPDGRPSARIVLLKGADAAGLVFFTNLASRKAAALAVHPFAALVLPWHDLGRQVRVEGAVGQIPRAETEAYFATRPYGSRLGAWASHQSTEVADRAELETAYAAAATRFPDPDDVPAPSFWGGYRVVPDRVEFWQGRPNRMHDRLRYERDSGGGWRLARLAP